MAYSIVGILAIAVHFIVNFDLFISYRHKRFFSGELYYLLFLFSVIAYHACDGVWGFLYDEKLIVPVTIDTNFYFIFMALSILAWSVFVGQYLGINGKQNRTIIILGVAFFAIQTIFILINFFVPLLFSFSDECIYKAEAGRYWMFGIQVIVYLMLASYSFVLSRHYQGSLKRRHIFVAVFSLFMLSAITLQVLFPLLPFYSIGYLLGTCYLHTFVISDRLTNQADSLSEAKNLLQFDSLTHVMSKHAYIDFEEKIDKQISDGGIDSFAMVVFDLNDLKKINDTYGHTIGDRYIIDASKLIRQHFAKSLVYRVGGDEFALFLFDDDYQNREVLFASFVQAIKNNIEKGNKLVVSVGMAEFKKSVDTTSMQVYTRADHAMYRQKRELKKDTKVGAVS